MQIEHTNFDEQTGVNEQLHQLMKIGIRAAYYIQNLHLAQVQHTSHWDTSDDDSKECLPTALRIIIQIFLSTGRRVFFFSRTATEGLPSRPVACR